MRSVSHSFIRSQLGLVPSRPIDAGHPRQRVGQHRLAEQRLGHAGAEHVGDRRSPRRAARSAPAPTSMATLLPGVEHVGGALQIAVRAAPRAAIGVADAVCDGAVLVRRRAPSSSPACPSGRSRRSRVRSARAMRIARSIEWRIAAGDITVVHVLAGHVLEQGLQIDLLLVVAAHRRSSPPARRSPPPAGDRAWRRRGRSAGGSRRAPTSPGRRPARR